jgi:hypothetical protein
VAHAIVFDGARDGFLAVTGLELLLDLALNQPDHLESCINAGLLRACAVVLRLHSSKAVNPALVLVAMALKEEHLEAAGEEGVVEALLSCFPCVPAKDGSLAHVGDVLAKALQCDANVQRCRAAHGTAVIFAALHEHAAHASPAVFEVFGHILALLGKPPADAVLPDRLPALLAACLARTQTSSGLLAIVAVMLAGSPQRQLEWARVGGTRAVLAAARAQRNCVHGTHYACSALAAGCSGQQQIKLDAGAKGAVELVYGVLTCHAADHKCVGTACNALNSLLNDAPANKLRLQPADLVSTLLATLAQHAGSAHVARFALSCLANLLGDEDDAAAYAAAAEARRAALAGGAGTAIVAAMRAFAYDANVVGSAAAALCGLYDDDDDDDDESPHRHGLAISCKAPSSATLAGVAEAGGMQALCTALSTFPLVERVDVTATRALRCMIARQPALATLAARCGAAPLVVAVLRRAQSTDAADGAMGALTALTASVEGASAVLQAGGCAAAQAYARGRPNDASACEYFCLLVTSVALASDDLLQPLSEGGTIEALLVALRRHTASPRVQMEGWNALTLLVGNHEHDGRRAAAVCGGGLELLRASPLRDGETAAHRSAFERVLLQAAERHDEHATGAAGCERCSALRAARRLCGMPGCACARRPGAEARSLQVCSACRGIGYCGAAHQKEHWEMEHKLTCKPRAAEGPTSM